MRTQCDAIGEGKDILVSSRTLPSIGRKKSEALQVGAKHQESRSSFFGDRQPRSVAKTLRKNRVQKCLTTVSAMATREKSALAGSIAKNHGGLTCRTSKLSLVASKDLFAFIGRTLVRIAG